jgi:predicted metal-binding membrane protein
MTMRTAWHRAPVWIGMAGVAATSWLILGRMGGGGMADMGSGASAQVGMAMAAMADPGAPTLAANFAMWAVMMMAMMLPTVAPSAAAFSMLAARREPQRRGSGTTAMYVTGYASMWIAYAAPAALLQWALTHALLLDAMARSTSSLLSAAILLAAGLYQFTPLKTACLSKCRTPLGYFMANWRDGARGALVLGARHGSYCVGCCWALMAVMFVVGAMNLVWMGLLASLMLGEKLIPAAWRFDRLVGSALIIAGAWVASGA